MFPDGLWGVSGVAGWLLMTGFWVGVVALALWALRRVLPASDSSHKRTRPAGGAVADADVLRQHSLG